MKKPTLAIPSTFLALAATTHAATLVLIDFGSSTTPTASESLSGTERFWNNVTSATGGQPVASPLALVNTSNTASGISLQMSNENTASAFTTQNSDGVNPSAGEAAARFYPDSATRDSLYGYTVSSGTFTAPSGLVTLVFSGLTPGQAYGFNGLASRNATGTRESLYTFTGANTGSDILNAASGTGTAAANTDLFEVTGILPDVNNMITLTVTTGATNSTSQKFFYLNVLEISAVPEPSSALAGVLGLGLLALRRRR